MSWSEEVKVWTGARLSVRQCLHRYFGDRGIPREGCSPVGELGVLGELCLEPERGVGWGGFDVLS